MSTTPSREAVARTIDHKLQRSLERWARTKPAAIPECSSAHIMFLVEDAQKDIALLASDLTAAKAEIEGLRAELAQAKADTERLDFLDRCNATLNACYGTTYGWTLVLNHNVNRLLLGGYSGGEPRGLDLHDSDGSNRKLPSCRAAIDERLGDIRRALAPQEGTSC